MESVVKLRIKHLDKCSFFCLFYFIHFHFINGNYIIN
jgi:hypothetical protein